MKLLVPSAFGVESVVKRQLARLGYVDNVRAVNGRIELSGDFFDVARINVSMRSAERVLIALTEFDAFTFDEVYDNVYAYDWSQILPCNARILVYAKSVNSQLFAIKSLCSVMKKAIVDKLQMQYKAELTEDGSRYMFELALLDNHAVLTLDTSGDGLHKRGYRTLAYSAPLKETLAAALIDLSVFNKDKQFADLFCGSGTIPIEAALYARKIAPNLNRDFDFTHFQGIDGKYLAQAREEARDLADYTSTLRISGFDLSPEAISISRYHAKNAGVDKDVHFQVGDMKDFSSKTRYGVMIGNPPYGERLNADDKLYSDLGKLYRSLPDWNFYILSAYPNTEKAFGRRADKNRKLYNANIECKYYFFLSAKPQKVLPDFLKKD